MFKNLEFKKILFIESVTPTPDMDSGSNGIFYLLKILQSLGNKIVFIPINMGRMNKYTADLQKMGIECIYGPYYKNVEKYLIKHGLTFDTVFLNRFNICIIV